MCGVAGGKRTPCEEDAELWSDKRSEGSFATARDGAVRRAGLSKSEQMRGRTTASRVTTACASSPPSSASSRERSARQCASSDSGRRESRTPSTNVARCFAVQMDADQTEQLAAASSSITSASRPERSRPETSSTVHMPPAMPAGRAVVEVGVLMAAMRLRQM